MEWWVILLLIVAVIFLLLLVMVHSMFSNMCCRHPETAETEEAFQKYVLDSSTPEWLSKIRSGMQWIEETPQEQVYIQSHDGLRLHGRLYENPNPNGRVIILSHGFHSTPKHDFSCACMFYYKHGYTILLIDQRSHGESEGKYICFGARERYDVRDWCKFINSRYGETVPLLLSGISMGSTTSLLTAGLPDAPKNLIGVIADCGYVSTYEEFRYVLRTRFHLPAFPLLQIAGLYCRVRGGFGLRTCNVLHAVKNIRVPILFAHGMGDKLVPFNNTERAYEACVTRKEIILVPEAAHGMSWVTDNKRYTETLLRFLDSL